MRITDLPIPIQILADSYSDEARIKEKKNINLSSYFSWALTSEGYGFWDKINQQNYEPFLEKYPEKCFKDGDYVVLAENKNSLFQVSGKVFRIGGKYYKDSDRLNILEGLMIPFKNDKDWDAYKSAIEVPVKLRHATPAEIAHYICHGFNNKLEDVINISDTVMLKPNIYPLSNVNPVEIAGRVEKINKDPLTDEGCYHVRWSNGYLNTYICSDLIKCPKAESSDEKYPTELKHYPLTPDQAFFEFDIKLFDNVEVPEKQKEQIRIDLFGKKGDTYYDIKNVTNKAEYVDALKKLSKKTEIYTVIQSIGYLWWNREYKAVTFSRNPPNRPTEPSSFSNLNTALSRIYHNLVTHKNPNNNGGEHTAPKIEGNLPTVPRGQEQGRPGFSIARERSRPQIVDPGNRKSFVAKKARTKKLSVSGKP